MAKKKKGPRQAVGLKCTKCGKFNYITEVNKNNDRMKKQTTGEDTFPLAKYCPACNASTEHKTTKNLK